MLENIIGVEDAAKILNLSAGTVKNKCASGELPSKKIGKTWILDKTLLEEWKMKKFNQLNDFNSTVIKWDGIVLKTNQTPYLINDNYQATAIDSDNNEYEISWKINHPDFENLEDESESCDWDNPISVIKL